MSGQPEAVQKAISDAYDAGFARGMKLGTNAMAGYLLTQLAPLTPAQQRWVETMRGAGEALGLKGAA
jgi:hypothetical protein